MDKILDAVVLGLLQGLTEFLPISSSGHLAIAEELLGWHDKVAQFNFNIAVHLGSLAAVVVFVRRELLAMLTTQRRLLLVLCVATLPVVVVGLLAKERVQDLGSNLAAVGGFLICTGAILFLVRRMGAGTGSARTLPYKKALFVGLFQALAILPGISRSGATLAAGLRMGMEREQAVRFAFLTAVPAIAGAGILMLFEWRGDVDPAPLSAGVLASFLTSLLAMRLMVAVVARQRLGWFALYCACAGTLAIAIS